MASRKDLQAQIAALNAQILSSVNSVQPNANIQNEGNYAADLMKRFRAGEDIASFMPGYIANIRAAATRNSEYERSLHGAGNRALGGVQGSNQGALDQEYGLKSRHQDFDSYLASLSDATGQAENTIFGAGQEADSINMGKMNAMVSSLSSQRDMVNQQLSQTKSKWSKFLGVLGLAGQVGAAWFTGGANSAANGLGGMFH